ncbi:MAG: response regulator transcription factor [Synergistaceae bacterium]|jgi:two-component system response regulator CpxR|nr:response regulator transcription factor [Synergistaceae bacterium]
MKSPVSAIKKIAGESAVKKILLIDDDKELCALLEDYFKADGFGFACAYSGDAGLASLARENFDIAILDVMLPGRDGFEILKEIRNRSSMPVIMLTAKGDHVDRVVGLEIGADDYICKPFNMRELSARIRAVLRRTAGGPNRTDHEEVISVADLVMDIGSRSVHVSGRPISLTNVEFRLLEALLSSAGNKMPPERLSLEVLGRDYDPFDRSLSVHICKLRQKLGPYPGGSERIKTLRGEGFVYVTPEKKQDGGCAS